MEVELVDWLVICGLVIFSLAGLTAYEVARSLDDGWLGDFVKKRKQKEVEPEEPPFPLDKPNSCQYCKHNLCTGLSYVCNAYDSMSKHVETWWWSKGRTGFRTWDRCDDYEPLKICTNCKYGPTRDIITETHIIADEEVKVMMSPTTKCPYESECKNAEKWEPKEGE